MVSLGEAWEAKLRWIKRCNPVFKLFQNQARNRYSARLRFDRFHPSPFLQFPGSHTVRSIIVYSLPEPQNRGKFKTKSPCRMLAFSQFQRVYLCTVPRITSTPFHNWKVPMGYTNRRQFHARNSMFRTFAF